MSKLPLLMSSMPPRLNPTHYRPLISLLKACHNPTLPTPTLFSKFHHSTHIHSPHHFSTFTPLCALPPAPAPAPNARSSRRLRREAPESVLKHKLDLCSKHNNLPEAMRLYAGARADGVPLSVHHFNVLLYLCSLSAGDGGDGDGLEVGFEVFRQMGVERVEPNEATFTSLARLALAKKDPELAFELVKRMRGSGIVPKLRSYGPALFGFCEEGDCDRAYEVDAHMVECGVAAEEEELAALLKVSVEAGRGGRVYEYLHRLRAGVRQVSEETAGIVEGWFASEAGRGVGVEDWDVEKVKEGVVRGGGGWHGQGWLGRGEWRVGKAVMDETGVCSCCGEKLVCIDIDPKETEGFATKLSSLACQREKKANFSQFQEWLKIHGPFDAVVDGANVGLINTHTFSFRQLQNVVNELREISPSKRRPLVILHRSRVYGGPAESPHSKRMLDSWRQAGALYPTPQGSNDDWYWLYAAVSNRCLLVTNDEMRDHLFQLLGNSIFPRWKEKHQVRMTVSKEGLDLHMPPPYSSVIQESEGGSWHVPTVIGDDIQTRRQWLCATRASESTPRVRARLASLFSTG